MDETARPSDIPQTIGRYQVQESIGYGAMGAVYKAFDPLIKRTLAIKTIRLDIPRGSPQYKSFIDRFYHESVRFTDFNVSPTCAPTRAAEE